MLLLFCFGQRKSAKYGVSVTEICGGPKAQMWRQTGSREDLGALCGVSFGGASVPSLQPRSSGPPRCGSCEGWRLIGGTTSQERSLFGRRGEEETSPREEEWSRSSWNLLRLGERRRIAGLDPELRERVACTDVGLDPAVTLGILLGGEASDLRRRGSAGATPSLMPARPRGGEGVRRGKGRLRSSRRSCSVSVVGRKAGTAVLPSPFFDMRSTHTFMGGTRFLKRPENLSGIQKGEVAPV